MNKLKNIWAVILLFSVVLFFACTVEPYEGTITDPNAPVQVNPAILPVLTTTTSSNITTTSASSGGNVTADGGSPVTARGVVWGTNQNPTIANSKTVDGTGIGNFVSSITNLATGNVYYVRAYATNANGTSYGSQTSFSISTPSNLPVLTTTAVTNNAYPGATSGGNITSDGGSPVIARGVVWSSLSNPTLPTTSKTVNGTGTGVFTSVIANLGVVPGTVINLRAYATNANGTSYGNQVTFTLAPSQVDMSPALMTANINGVQYDRMQPYLYSFINNDVGIYNNGAPVNEQRQLHIQGDTSDNLNTLKEINLYIPTIKWVPGTYSLREREGLGDQTFCQALVTGGIAGLVTGGSITITEFNLTTKRIKGTFNITYDNSVSGGSTGLQITNGTFNYGLDHAYFN